MNTTTVEVRPRTSAGTHVRRTLPDATRAFMRLLGTDHRRCWCLRCLLTRTGLYRRARTQNDRAIEIETRVLGMRIRRKVTRLDD